MLRSSVANVSVWIRVGAILLAGIHVVLIRVECVPSASIRGVLTRLALTRVMLSRIDLIRVVCYRVTLMLEEWTLLGCRRILFVLVVSTPGMMIRMLLRLLMNLIRLVIRLIWFGRLLILLLMRLEALFRRGRLEFWECLRAWRVGELRRGLRLMVIGSSVCMMILLSFLLTSICVWLHICVRRILIMVWVRLV